MAKHYIYRVDHDRGFAPNVEYGICTLCGCKINTIESWAQKGSWVIGVGGNGTGKSNKLIYAMEVKQVLSRAEFRARYRRKSTYLRGKAISAANVLLSRKFYYFGDNAIDLPKELRHIVIRGRGCKRVSDEDILKLSKYLKREHTCGTRGRPNNPPKEQQTRC
jgi:hypothetical protein